jgi:hypothetical protein
MLSRFCEASRTQGVKGRRNGTRLPTLRPPLPPHALAIANVRSVTNTHCHLNDVSQLSGLTEMRRDSHLAATVLSHVMRQTGHHPPEMNKRSLTKPHCHLNELHLNDVFTEDPHATARPARRSSHPLVHPVSCSRHRCRSTPDMASRETRTHSWPLTVRWERATNR